MKLFLVVEMSKMLNIFIKTSRVITTEYNCVHLPLEKRLQNQGHLKIFSIFYRF